MGCFSRSTEANPEMKQVSRRRRKEFIIALAKKSKVQANIDDYVMVYQLIKELVGG